MAKNKKPNRAKKSHIKHKQFEDMNISALEDHPQAAGKLNSPFSLIGNQSYSSWRDNGLHEFLWATIVRCSLPQKEALDLFRRIIIVARTNHNQFKDTFVSHSALSILTEEDFDLLMEPVLTDDICRESLRALLYFETLPDVKHWRRHLEEPTETSNTLSLMNAVNTCLEHQSQETTDIRWLKLMYCIVVQQRLSFPESFAERLEEFRLYPDKGEQTSVRPSIRSMELTLRAPHHEGVTHPYELPEAILERIPAPWNEDFWKECLKKTECIIGDFKNPPTDENTAYFEQFLDAYDKLSAHFVFSLESTSLDARRDSAFGLVLYTLFIGLAVARNNLCSRPEGRILLRTIVECYITLKFLVHKDDPTIWHQYRQYGTGQTKLAFLKNLREDSIPDFINLDELHRYANEDMWQEFTDIGIKPWAEKNLRSMATEAGIKDFYDKYYDWSSAYVHGNWGAVRDSVFTVCMNPLHRFHRIPVIPNIAMTSVLPDAAKLNNLMLDLIGQIYPPFNLRIKHPSKN